jgi:hypothetical protein
MQTGNEAPFIRYPPQPTPHPAPSPPVPRPPTTSTIFPVSRSTAGLIINSARGGGYIYILSRYRYVLLPVNSTDSSIKKIITCTQLLSWGWVWLAPSCNTMECCLCCRQLMTGWFSFAPTPGLQRDFDPCFQPLDDDDDDDEEEEVEQPGPIASVLAAVNSDVAASLSVAAGDKSPTAAAAAAPLEVKKSLSLKAKLPVDSPKKIKFGGPPKPPRHFDYAALSTGSQPNVMTTPGSDRKAASSSSGSSRKEKFIEDHVVAT